MNPETGGAVTLRLVEAAVCGVAAVGLHLAALALWAAATMGGAPATQGAAAVAVSAPDAALRALVETWDRPPAAPTVASPQAAPTPVAAPPLPEAAPVVPEAPASRFEALALTAPQVDAVPAVEPSTERPPPEPPARPLPRPARSSPPPPPAAEGSAGSAPRPAGVASGPGAAALEESFGAAVRTAIARRQTYPGSARARGIEGATTLRVRVARDGRLLGASVARSSGSALLDAASLEAARSAGPFDPAPPALPGADFTFELRLVYALR